MSLSKNVAVKDFPSDFAWGAATAAYQIEGRLLSACFFYLLFELHTYYRTK